MDVSKTIKVTASTLTVLGLVFGAVFFMDDRHQKVADAKEMRVQIEKAAVETFQQQQRYTDAQREKLQMEMYILRLNSLKEDRRDVERRLEKDPNNDYLKRKLERIENWINRLEDKLYQ